MNPFIQAWLLQAFVLFLIVGSLAGLAVGVLLFWRPQAVRRAGQKLNRWISTRQMDQALERTVSLDHWFYRHHRISGAASLLGALYILYFFTARMQREQILGGLARSFQLPPQLAAGLLDAVVLSALVGALFAVLVSLFLLLRPSMLRGFEQGANQWVSLRRALKPAEIVRPGVDEYVFLHARQAGALLILGSLYVLAMLLSWLGH